MNAGLRPRSFVYQPPVAAEVFVDRLRRLALPVARYWGVHYPILVTRDDVEYAGINFRELVVNARLAGVSDAELQMVLAHEWGHRTRAPKGPRAHARMRAELTSRLGIGVQLADHLTAVAYDLIVDRW